MKRDDVILKKLLSYATKAMGFVAAITEQEFIANDEKQYAVCLALLQAGEMASLLTEEFREKHNNVPWRNIRGFRNIIAHHYSTVDVNLVWKLLSRDLPELILMIEDILKEESAQ